MTPLELENSIASTAAASNNSQTNNPPETLPAKSDQPTAAAVDFWQSIKTIIGLQNQAPPLLPVSRNESLPLSFPQERLWFLHQLNPDSSAHNLPTALQLTGTLNVSALEQSLNEIIKRHEALRTNFAAVDGKPIQVVHPFSAFKLPIVDFTKTQNPQSTIQSCLIEEASRPFNLSQDSLLRATLLQLGEEEHILILTVHHIVFDGWSEGLLFRELATFYEAFCCGTPHTLAELPIQYPDFAVWQRQWLQGEIRSVLLSYWKQQLENLTMQQLPADRPRPTIQTRRSACQTLSLSKNLTDALKLLGRQAGGTLFATLLAAFKVLMHAYTGQEDLFVCTPTANRNRSQIKNLMGYFVNLLVLRSDLSGNPSFRQLLDRVRQVVSAANAHQDLPIQELVNSLNLTHTPLSQVAFALQNFPRQLPQLSGLQVSSLDIDSGTADFDLFLSLVEDAGTISGVLKYNTDLFDAATITQMLGDFQTLLENLVANPEQPIASLLPQITHSKVAPAPLQQQSKEGPVSPRNALELQLKNIWEKVLGVEPIGINDNFFELGGHSLLAVNLFAEIEKICGQNLPLATLLQAPTIEQLAEIIRKSGWSASDSPLVPLQPKGSKPPFFCVTAAGCTALGLMKLANRLGPEQPFYALEEKVVDGKETSSYQVEVIASQYIQEIRTIQPQGPYLLGGHSFGGKVAFEMAQQLHAQGEKVAVLAMIDTVYDGAPVGGQALPSTNNVQASASKHLEQVSQLGVQEKLKYLYAYVQRRLSWEIKRIKRKIANLQKTLDDKAKTLACNFYLAIGYPLPPTLRYFHVFQKMRETRKSYKVQVYPDRVTYLRALDVPKREFANRLIWKNFAGGGFELHDIPGHHGSIKEEPNVKILAQKITDSIDKALAD